MDHFIRFLRTHTLWLGFLAVVIPLLSLLGLQYVWLDRLEQTSAIAHQAALRNYLEAVATEVEYFYRSTAQRVLNVSSSPFLQENLKKIAKYWSKKPMQGVRRLFLVDYTRVRTGNFYAYDPERHALMPTPATEESLAIVIASLPWQAWVRTSAAAESVGLQVNEQDPNHRIILNPITDDRLRIVGTVAMVLDEKYFRKKLLPAAVDKALPSFFPQEAGEHLVVTVRDHEQDLVLGRKVAAGSVPAVTLRFHFVFADWTLGLHSLGPTPHQWARRSFVFNMALGVLLAVVLLGGIILALRAANKAMRLSRMKSDFVSNVSHELRTPLASIRVFAEFLRLGRATSPQKVQEYGEYIEMESLQLSGLINNILDFSRIESGRKTYRFVLTDLGDVVQSVMKSHTVRLKQYGFQVTLQLPTRPLPRVDVDPDAISQAIHNLLDNAAKYSQESKIIVVRLHSEDDSLVISVEDQGMGIAKQAQERIFERFHRVGTGLVHDIKGAGLGLSIVHHIVRAHGGAVTVESEIGKGSTFSIRLPAKTESTTGRSGTPDTAV